MDLLLDALFFMMFGVALVRFVREPDRLHRDVLAVFASFAGLFLIGLVLQLLPGAPRILSAGWIVLLYLQPPLTLRLAGHFRRQRRWLIPAAFVGMLVSLVLVFTVDVSRGPALVLVVGYLVVTDLIGAREFHRAARDRIGTARVRLDSSALATTLFAIALVIVGIAAAARAIGTPFAGADQLARLLAVLAALGYLGAFLPPRRLLLGVQRSIAFGWLAEIARDSTDVAGEVWQALAQAARGISGAGVVAVLIDDDLVASAGDPVDRALMDELLLPARLPGPRSRGRRSLLPRTRRPSSATTEAARVIRLEEAGSRIRLVLLFEGTPLFVEDDLSLIEMLAREAARTMARDRAMGQRATLERELVVARLRGDAEARFRSLIDAQPTALVAAGPGGRIRYANQRANDLFRRDQEAILDDTIDRLVPGVVEATGAGIDPDGSVPGEGSARSQFEAIAHLGDGSTIPVEVGLRRWSVEEEVLTLVTVTDISDRRAAETMRERFLDLLSHELRTPVTSIYGGAHLLASRRGRLEVDTEREVLVSIAAEADRLQRMVENLITLARVERGAPTVGEDPVLLQRLVPRLIAQEREQWPDARFEHRLPAGLATVCGDDDYLGQVVRNLLSNAVKYGGEDRVIEVSAVEGEDTVTLAVADRGPGFAPDEAESLFDLYYRSETVSRQIQGAGIGLFVCRRIVEAMGGRMRASLRSGGGSIFEVELPIYPSEERIVRPTPSTVRELEPSAGAPAKAYARRTSAATIGRTWTASSSS